MLAMSLGVAGAQAQSIGDILGSLGSGSTGDIIGNVLEGVFSSSNITVADIVGSYVSQGPAVTFKSENFLQKAGGIAGAAALESKLQPYYDQYGLNGMTLEIDENSNFSMKVKGINLKGTITKNEGDGTFDFNLSVLGMNVGKFTAYIEKSLSNLNVMFDADKLMKIISTVAKFTGNSVASAMGSILDSYDGACVGFKMVKTGSSSSTQPGSTMPATPSDNNGTGSSGNASEGNGQSSGIGGLMDILNKNKK